MIDPTGITVLPFKLHLFGPFDLTGFGLAMLLAFVIAQMVATSELLRRGQQAGADAMPDITVGAVVGGLAGAKIYYAILMGSVASLFDRAGFVFWGGLIGGIVATSLVIRWKKLPFSRIADANAIGLAAAYAVGRSGCWAVGDDYGRPWISRWAVKFPDGAPSSTVGNISQMFRLQGFEGRPLNEVLSVYPTQLFEVAMGMAMFAVLWRLRKHRHAEGWLFGVYCVLAGVERFIVEFFRAKDDRFFGPLTMAQVIAIGFAVGGVVWMQMRRDVKAGQPGIQAA
jgi:phosphatidylglycerol:prolipoprotein diacylglycerol transferase